MPRIIWDHHKRKKEVDKAPSLKKQRVKQPKKDKEKEKEDDLIEPSITVKGQWIKITDITEAQLEDMNEEEAWNYMENVESWGAKKYTAEAKAELKANEIELAKLTEQGNMMKDLLQGVKKLENDNKILACRICPNAASVNGLCYYHYSLDCAEKKKAEEHTEPTVTVKDKEIRVSRITPEQVLSMNAMDVLEYKKKLDLHNTNKRVKVIKDELFWLKQSNRVIPPTKQIEEEEEESSGAEEFTKIKNKRFKARMCGECDEEYISMYYYIHYIKEKHKYINMCCKCYFLHNPAEEKKEEVEIPPNCKSCSIVAVKEGYCNEHFRKYEVDRMNNLRTAMRNRHPIVQVYTNSKDQVTHTITDCSACEKDEYGRVILCDRCRDAAAEEKYPNESEKPDYSEIDYDKWKVSKLFRSTAKKLETMFEGAFEGLDHEGMSLTRSSLIDVLEEFKKRLIYDHLVEIEKKRKEKERENK